MCVPLDVAEELIELGLIMAAKTTSADNHSHSEAFGFGRMPAESGAVRTAGSCDRSMMAWYVAVRIARSSRYESAHRITTDQCGFCGSPSNSGCFSSLFLMSIGKAKSKTAMVISSVGAMPKRASARERDFVAE